MTTSYLIVVLLTAISIIPGIKPRLRLTLLELFIFALLLVAPLSLTRDVPQYQEIFENLFGISNFPESLVRIMLAVCYIGILEVMVRRGFSIGSIITFTLLAIPTLAANQLRLSFAIFTMLFLSNRLTGISNTLIGILIHQSIILNLLLHQPHEQYKNYGIRLIIILIVGIVFIINASNIAETLLPYLGNTEIYLRAKEISDIYDQTNLLNGIEFVIYFFFISMQARSIWPAVSVSAAYILSKMMTEIPVVITMRFFELLCLLIISNNLQSLKIQKIPIIMFGSILLTRFYLHYSSPISV